MPCRPAISSMSLGRAWVHKLPHKLDMAQRYGYQGIELFYEDLEYYAKEEHGSADPSALLAAAHDIRRLCAARGLTILCIQPFPHYGALRDRRLHQQKIQTMRLWFKICHALNTSVIGLCSSYLPADQLINSTDLLVQDMIEIADLAARQSPPIRFAFESLSWGTYADIWEQSWEVVKRVNRPNFGMCLDTFNITGRVYADPASPTGKTPNAEADIAASMRRLRETVDPSKIFFIQVVDAERLEEPLVKGHKYYAPDQVARMSWSRNCRCFYREEERGAYLPVKDVATAILDMRKGLGFSGWVSMELYSRTMNDPAPEVPAEHARRGMESWERLKGDVDMDLEEPKVANATPALAKVTGVYAVGDTVDNIYVVNSVASLPVVTGLGA